MLNHRPRFWDGRPVCGAAIAAAGVCGAAIAAAGVCSAAVSAAVFLVQPSRLQLFAVQPSRLQRHWAAPIAACRRDARTTNSPGRSLPRATFGCDSMNRNGRRETHENVNEWTRIGPTPSKSSPLAPRGRGTQRVPRGEGALGMSRFVESSTRFPMSVHGEEGSRLWLRASR